MTRPRLAIGLVGALAAVTVGASALHASADSSALPGLGAVLPVADPSPTCGGITDPILGQCIPTTPPTGLPDPTATTAPSASATPSASGSPSSTTPASPTAAPCNGITDPVLGQCIPTSMGTASATPAPSGSAAPSASAPACPGQTVPVLGVCLTPPGGASASPSATPTASTSPGATPSGTPTPSPTAMAPAPTATVTPGTITAKQSAVVTGSAEPGARVDLYAYSRPSTTYTKVRTAVADSNGGFAFTVGPSGNTRLYVSSGGQNSNSAVLNVRTDLNLKVTRTGTRTYRFTGSTLPKRKGQLVTVFYEVPGGKRVIASRARVSDTGTYNVTRTFGSTATYDMYTGTGVDNNNAAGTSPKVRVRIR